MEEQDNSKFGEKHVEVKLPAKRAFVLKPSLQQPIFLIDVSPKVSSLRQQMKRGANTSLISLVSEYLGALYMHTCRNRKGRN